jgi:hypothetical protein
MPSLFSDQSIHLVYYSLGLYRIPGVYEPTWDQAVEPRCQGIFGQLILEIDPSTIAKL